jgi:AraC family L-rhamnose operon transcriptional activator RhaR
VSRRALERAFRRVLGRSLNTEIRQAHLGQSKDLLASTELGMRDVARLSGFSGFKDLATVFRQLTGMTPTAYREQFRFPAGAASGLDPGAMG